MTKIFALLTIIAGCYSCASSSTLQRYKKQGFTIELRRFYSPCCGPCGMSAHVSTTKDQEVALLINFKPESRGSESCLWPGSLGAQKQLRHYKGKKLLGAERYLPIYDTAKLAAAYPGLLQLVRKNERQLQPGYTIIPLDGLDSAMIESASGYRDAGFSCNNAYLKFIKGFIKLQQ